MIQNKLTHLEIQKAAYDVLQRVVKVCEIHNLKYVLAYGTLLGAVRHQNFIPWDDDIDIMMPLEHYMELREILNDNASEHGLKLHDSDTNEYYPYLIGRVDDGKTKIVRTDELDYDIGVFVDIYPIQKLGSSIVSARGRAFLLGILSSLYFASTRIKTEPYARGKLHRKAIIRFAQKVGHRRLKKLIYLIAKSASEQKSTDYVAPCIWMSPKSSKNIYSATIFEDCDRLLFGKKKFAVPKYYHMILKNYYGDYMQFPPKELQKPHHEYSAYYRSLKKSR